MLFLKYFQCLYANRNICGFCLLKYYYEKIVTEVIGFVGKYAKLLDIFVGA
jgi:hypothetical protein